VSVSIPEKRAKRKKEKKRKKKNCEAGNKVSSRRKLSFEKCEESQYLQI
jgi:hypothetical protein